MDCQVHGAYAVAAVSVLDGVDGTMYAQLYWYAPGGASLATPYRYSISAGKLVYIVINQYHRIPDDVLNTVVTAYASATTGSEVYVDVIDVSPAASINLRGSLVTATNGRALGFNTLCYIPPVATATPADLSRVPLASGSQLNLARTVTYGDIAVATVGLGMIVVILLAVFLWSPRLRL